MIEQRLIHKRSLRSRLLSLLLRWRLKPRLTSADFDPQRFRAWLERSSAKRKTCPGVSIRVVEQEQIRGEWHEPESAPTDQCMLYLHGGGYLFGSPRTYRSFTTHLAKLSDCALFSLDYRLAPEAPFPAAVQDAMATYQWLRKRFPAQRIVLAGDSAGGGLALALIHALKAANEPLPGGAMLLSPYTDLLATGASLQSNAASCVMFDANSIRRAAEIYLAGQDGASPLASPLYGDFSGFPPVLIQVSDNEVLRDDSLRLAERLDQAGVAVRLDIWRGQAHVWPTFYPLLPEAGASLRDLASFANACWQRWPLAHKEEAQTTV